MPRGAWAVLFVAAGIGPAAAQPVAPAGPAPVVPGPLEPLPPAAASALPPAATVRGMPSSDHPPPILGAPVVRGEPVRSTSSESSPIAASFIDKPAVQKPTRAAGLGAPIAADVDIRPVTTPIAANTVDSRVRQIGATTPPATDPVNDLLTRRSGYKPDSGRRDEPRSSGKIGDKLDGALGDRGEWFRSDHAFDGFISPVTNPFLFEDPRSITEVKPIFIYQKMPSAQPDFGGGNISYFGVQGRLAVTDRLSFVFNKLGGIWLNSASGSPLEGHSGFAELWFGPKYTFIRNEDCGTLLAGGLQFQLPVGSESAYQGTGNLSLVPYVSYGQNLFRDFQAGSFNTIATAGYAFSTTTARSDYMFLSGHIDMDVGNCHHFYPLFEMNYFITTTNGNTTPIGVEGRDLINFGGRAAGKGFLTGAFGARYKITEAAQIGTAFEIPFAGPRDLFRYRFTLDFIWRF